MKTIEEMLADVRADHAHRKQLEQEQEQKRRDCQEAVTLAEKELQDALARQDPDAYHAAEGRLSYAREVLRTFESASPWWTHDEGAGILYDTHQAYRKETKEKYEEVIALIHKINNLLGDAHHISRNARAIDTIIRPKLKSENLPNYGYSGTQQEVPADWARHIAMQIGQSYSPPRKY